MACRVDADACTPDAEPGHRRRRRPQRELDDAFALRVARLSLQTGVIQRAHSVTLQHCVIIDSKHNHAQAMSMADVYTSTSDKGKSTFGASRIHVCAATLQQIIHDEVAIPGDLQIIVHAAARLNMSELKCAQLGSSLRLHQQQ
eukprot:7505396-Heterocapsa_arctica.AAC.1